MPSARTAGKSSPSFLEELPILVQQEVELRHPRDYAANIAYSAKVLEVNGNHLRITLPRQADGNGYLRSSARVIVSFVLKNVLYETGGEYIADGKQVRELVLDPQLCTANRRRSPRLAIPVETVFVPVSELSLTNGQLSHLKWKRCRTLDVSDGGMLVSVPIRPAADAYLLANLDIETLAGPLFVFGQVRWISSPGRAAKEIHCGVRFIPAEELHHHFSQRALSGMPPILYGFTRKRQKELGDLLHRLSPRKNKGE